MKIKSESKGVEIIKDRIASDEWWSIFSGSPKGRDVSRAVEAKHYIDKSMVNFDIVFGFIDGLLLSFSIAKKKCMTLEQFNKILAEQGQKQLDKNQDTFYPDDLLKKEIEQLKLLGFAQQHTHNTRASDSS